MTQTPRRRAGFSLVELLVVIAIMTILAALMAAAVLKMLSVPPQKNTELLIQKLTSSLDQQWTAVITQCKTEAIPPAIWSQAMTAAGNDPQAAMNLYIRWRLVQEFPDSLAQAAAPPGGLLPKAIFNGLANPAVPPPAKLSGESSMLLYQTLMVARRGMEFDASALSPKEARQVGTGVFVLYDGWDEPLQFKNNALTGGKFEIRSAGPRKVLGDADDVTSDMLRLGR